MKQNEIFSNAKWLSPSEETASALIRANFHVERKSIYKARIAICGLGFFEFFINGNRGTEDKFIPLYTDYCKCQRIVKNVPFDEVTSSRIICPKYDITGFVSEGDNLLAVQLAPGWFVTDGYGKIKLIYKISIEYSDGSTQEILSSPESVKWEKSYITGYDIFHGETHDMRLFADGWEKSGFDDSRWKNASPADAPETEYYFSDCPADREIRHIAPRLISESGDVKIYDMGENISGYVTIEASAREGCEIKLRHAENLTSDGEIFRDHLHRQHSVFICDGKKRKMHVEFTWNAFRYAELTGDGKITDCTVVHTDVKCTSEFSSSDDTLNFIYNAFIRTQLDNMHSGIPSDCPHFERRGYTGDGQLVCGAAMTTLDTESFYRKWIADISDCQDRLTGHVQYTAPYSHCGGGPGGWGGAIVEVPYRFYRHYGDISFMKNMLPQMLRYFDYLDAHSEDYLVTSDRAGEWCLGEWACKENKILIPPPLVNNYFYVKEAERILSLEKELALPKDAAASLQNRAALAKDAIVRYYFNKETGDFAENVQCANAFALDIGLGNGRTYENLLDKIRRNTTYDTGIFGTDILTRLLFRRGEPLLAYKLLTNRGECSFYSWMSHGATTLWEHWLGERSRNHPMFGAVTEYLFTDILGIKQSERSSGFSEVIISPANIPKLENVRGSVTTPRGKLSVSISRRNGKTHFQISLPDGVSAEFSYLGANKTISGECELSV